MRSAEVLLTSREMTSNWIFASGATRNCFLTSLRVKSFVVSVIKGTKSPQHPTIRIKPQAAGQS